MQHNSLEPDVQDVTPEGKAIAIPRRLDPEDAQLALQILQSILNRPDVAEALEQLGSGETDEAGLPDAIASEIGETVNKLHPADIAFILERLPEHEMQDVKGLVDPAHDAGAMLGVADWTRGSLI